MAAEENNKPRLINLAIIIFAIIIMGAIVVKILQSMGIVPSHEGGLDEFFILGLMLQWGIAVGCDVCRKNYKDKYNSVIKGLESKIANRGKK